MKIALLLGGASSERQVSKNSGKSVYNALLKNGFEVVLIDPAYGKNQPKITEEFFDEKDIMEYSEKKYIQAFDSDLFQGIDAAFIALHGKWGEDGTVQSILDLKGIKYSGSGVLSSAIAMDKDISKQLFRRNGINTADWTIVEKNKYNLSSLFFEIDNVIKYPCIIKPNDQGSTFGLSLCGSKNEIETSLIKAFKYSDKAIVETYIPGRELTVGILEGKALPVLEIEPQHELYDYDCKYTSGMSQYFVPADIPPDTALEIQNQAELTFKTLLCKDFGRVDFRMTRDNKFYCLEANTLPGLTSTSLLPKMAKAAGIEFEELIAKIISLALK